MPVPEQCLEHKPFHLRTHSHIFQREFINPGWFRFEPELELLVPWESPPGAAGPLGTHHPAPLAPLELTARSRWSTWELTTWRCWPTWSCCPLGTHRPALLVRLGTHRLELLAHLGTHRPELLVRLGTHRPGTGPEPVPEQCWSISLFHLRIHSHIFQRESYQSRLVRVLEPELELLAPLELTTWSCWSTWELTTWRRWPPGNSPPGAAGPGNSPPGAAGPLGTHRPEPLVHLELTTWRCWPTRSCWPTWNSPPGAAGPPGNSPPGAAGPPGTTARRCWSA